MSVVDYYQILQLPRDADEVQIKKSYKALALKWHPDKNIKNKELCTKIFLQIQEAYDVLSDSIKRRLYDGEIRDQEDKRNVYRPYKHTHNHYHENHQKFNCHKKPEPHNPFKHEKKIDLSNKLNTTWFDGYSDKPDGFYTLCRKLFVKLGLELNKPKGIPPFGNSNSKYATTVSKFYKYWTTVYIEPQDDDYEWETNKRSIEIQSFVEYIKTIDERVTKKMESQRLKAEWNAKHNGKGDSSMPKPTWGKNRRRRDDSSDEGSTNSDSDDDN